MKKLALSAILVAVTLGPMAASAKDASNSSAAIRALARTPVAELPAAATKIITAAPEKDQAVLVGAVVRKVARTHPAALRHVVAALAKSEPKLAAIAAGAAVRAHPESTLQVTTSACTAAPEHAAEILSMCSKVSVVDNRTLAEVVAKANPVFSADTLVQQASTLDVTVDAAVVRGGTVIYPIIPPGALGVDLNGNPVNQLPNPVGPGVPGFDPDRYAAAGR